MNKINNNTNQEDSMVQQSYEKIMTALEQHQKDGLILQEEIEKAIDKVEMKKILDKIKNIKN